jgi:hypothetical protein
VQAIFSSENYRLASCCDLVPLRSSKLHVNKTRRLFSVQIRKTNHPSEMTKEDHSVHGQLLQVCTVTQSFFKNIYIYTQSNSYSSRVYVILSCVKRLETGFGLVIGFIRLLQHVTTNNYSSFTSLRTLQFTMAREYFLYASLGVATQRLPTMGIPPTSTHPSRDDCFTRTSDAD